MAQLEGMHETCGQQWNKHRSTATTQYRTSAPSHTAITVITQTLTNCTVQARQYTHMDITFAGL